MKPRLLGALLSALLLALSFPLTLLPLPDWLLGLLPYEVVADPALGPFAIPGLPTHLGYLQFPWLAYVALVPLLLAVRAARRSREAFLLGFLSGFAWLLLTLLWLVSFGFIPVLLLALYFALPVGLFGWLAWHLMHLPAAPRLEVARLVWGLPLLWTALEYLRSFGLWAFPWNLLGYTQAAYPLLAQTADLGGVYLVTFLVVLVNSAAVTLISSAGTFGLRAAHTALAVLLLAAALGYGWWRIDHLGPEAKPPGLTFALVQGGISSLKEWDDQSFQQSLQAYTGTTRQLLGLPAAETSSAIYLPNVGQSLQTTGPSPAAEPTDTRGPQKRVPSGDVLFVWPEGSILKRGGIDLDPTADGVPYEIRRLVQGEPQHAILWGALGFLPPPPPPPIPPVELLEPAATTSLPAPAVSAPPYGPAAAAPELPVVSTVEQEQAVARAEALAVEGQGTPDPAPAQVEPVKPDRPERRPKPMPQPKPKSPEQLARERRERFVNGGILTTAGGSAWEYAKVRLVPYGEIVPFRGIITFLRFPWNFGAGDLNAGKDLAPLEWRGYKIGPLICFDNVFNFIPAAEALAGAQYLVLMTNNSWYPMRSGIRQHADIDVLRAIETRRPLLRCSTTGWSQLVDRSGRIVQSTEQAVGQAQTLVVAPAPGSGSTLYMRAGDLFAQLCLLLALLFTVPPLVVGRSEGFL